MTDATGDGALAFVRQMIERDVLAFGDFVLKSGRHSPYFFNLGAIADGAGLDAIGRAYAREVVKLPALTDVLFGPAYKGIPIAVATAIALGRDHGRRVGAAFDRKEAKTHGEGGRLVGARLDGRRVVIVDDVVTDGTAKREAFDLISAAGGKVVGVVLALDRQEPSGGVGSPGTGAPLGRGDPVGGGGETAVEALERSFGVPIRCVANLDDVLRFLDSDDRYAEQHRRLKRYRQSGEPSAEGP